MQPEEPVQRRLRLAAVAAAGLVLVVAGGVIGRSVGPGAPGPVDGVRGGEATEDALGEPGTPPPGPLGWTTVVVGRAALSVPPTWRVVEVDGDAATCPAFDAPAVYLHTERGTRTCPPPLPSGQRAVGIGISPSGAAGWLRWDPDEAAPVAADGSPGLRRAPDGSEGAVEYLFLRVGAVLQVSVAGEDATIRDVVATLREANAADRLAAATARELGEASACEDLPPAGEEERVGVGRPPLAPLDSPGWTSLPQPPLVRARATQVWTGRELLYFGGDTDLGGKHHADAAAFDVAAGTWRCLPRAPVPGRSGARGVWTGTEVLLWGGYPRPAGAAYHPGTGTWRLLPDPPLRAPMPVAAVWTGEAMVVWGDTTRAGPRADGAAYDPRTDRWTPVAEAPQAVNVAGAVWTGTEMVVVGTLQDHNNQATTDHAIALAYAPQSDAWRALPSPPLSPQASTVTWTGERVVAVDYLSKVALYDPVSGGWEAGPDVPVTMGECGPQSAPLRRFVLVVACDQAALLDLDGLAWTVVEVPAGAVGTLTATGDTVLLAGATHERRHNGLWRFDAPERGP